MENVMKLSDSQKYFWSLAQLVVETLGVAFVRPFVRPYVTLFLGNRSLLALEDETGKCVNKLLDRHEQEFKKFGINKARVKDFVLENLH